MDYFKHYNLLISRAKDRVIESYTETHHIIPRCMNGSDDSSNLVELTPEEHYLAHQLLVKMYPLNEKLMFAANMMCANRPSNKVYGWLRRRMSNHMKTHNPNMNGAVNRKRKGTYTISAEGKKNISIGMITNSVNVGEKNPMYGVKPWMHPRATELSKLMWSNANNYYEWWKNSGLQHGQNRMAREFNEKYCITHANLIKYFKNGWIPYEDEEWKSCFKK
jgi:hypothetical protein